MNKRLSKGLHSEELQPTFDVIDKIKGTTLYNHNQHWIEVEQEDGTKAKQNEYNSLRVDFPVNSNTILETLITEMYPQNIEQKLLNDYNAANAGIEDKEKAQPYIDFLGTRKSLRAMVEADCKANGIPLG